MDWSVEQIPLEENSEADALAKMATCLEDNGDREIISHTVMVSTIESEPVTLAVNSWMCPILRFIMSGTLPKSPTEEKRNMRQASRFTVVDEALYRRSFQGPLLKCVSGEDVDYVLREIHMDVSGTISGNITDEESSACGGGHNEL